MTGIQASSKSALGYERDPELQARFDGAAQHLRAVDGLSDRDHDGKRRLVADLALEGGGVNGIVLPLRIPRLERARAATAVGQPRDRAERLGQHA